VPNDALFKGVLTNTNLVLKSLVLYKGLGKSTKFLFNLKLKPDLILLMHSRSRSDQELLSLKVPTISFLDSNTFCDYKTELPNNKSNLFLLHFFINILKKRSEMLKIKKINSESKVLKSITENQNRRKERFSSNKRARKEKAIKKFLCYF
jgi:hypothetical protein